MLASKHLPHRISFIDHIKVRETEAVIYFVTGRTFEYIFGTGKVHWLVDKLKFIEIFQDFIFEEK